MLAWKKFSSYADASAAEKCLYVFTKGSGYLYIGKAKKFGGKSGRYAHGYGYLVDALIESGANLYIATLTAHQWNAVRDFENTLIASPKGKLAVNKRRVKAFQPVKGLKGP